MLRVIQLFASSLLILSIGAVAARGQEASITLLKGWPKAVSDNGVVAGEDLEGAYRWTAEGGYERLPDLDPEGDVSNPFDISADGGTIVGYSNDLPVRWTANGVEKLSDESGYCWAVSADGSVIAGVAHISVPVLGQKAFRWTQDDGLQVLETRISGEFTGNGTAYNVSRDGNFVVGQAQTVDGFDRAVRWLPDGTMEDLAAGIENTFHAALDVSADGRFVVGVGKTPEGELRGMLWHEAFGAEELPGFFSLAQSSAQRISDAGTVIVGRNSDWHGGNVCVWTDGEPRTIRDFLETDYGIDLTGWGWIDVPHAMSGDGTKFICEGDLNGQRVGFLVTLPPPPKIEGAIDETPDAAAGAPPRFAASPTASPVSAGRTIKDGEIIRARVGQPLELDFTALDPGGDDLRFFAENVPSTATLSPQPGDPVSASFQGTFRWTPAPEDLGTSRLVHLYVRDVEDRRASLRFELRGAPAIAPTVEPLTPVIVECRPGANRVRLETRVDDVEGDSLTVVWRVNGKYRKGETVAAGSVVAFEYDYPHGESEAQVEVSDGGDPVVANTTVTVQDTTSPIVVVAPRLTLPVQKGELFASRSALKVPTVRDACDEAPTVRSDAPSRLKVGRHVVTWKVTDASGNVASAKQTVVVVNEAPVADAGKTVRKATHRSEAQVRLNGRKSDDPDRHKLRYVWRAAGVKLKNANTSAPTGRFPIGTTKVTLTVIDEGGRRSTDTTQVVIRKLVKRRAAAGAARLHAGNAYELSVHDGARRTLQPLQETAHREAAAAYALASLPDLSPDASEEERATYSEVRTRQALHAQRAAAAFYQAYLLENEEASLHSAVEAYRGAVFALQDAAER